MAADEDIQDTRISKSASALPAKSENSTPYVDFRTLAAMMSSQAEMHFLQAVGLDGVELEIDGLPFDPAAVLLFNVDNLRFDLKLPTLAGATNIRQITDGTISVLGADGITLGAKGERKVTLGTAVQAVDEVLHLVIFGGRGVNGSA